MRLYAVLALLLARIPAWSAGQVRSGAGPTPAPRSIQLRAPAAGLPRLSVPGAATPFDADGGGMAALLKSFGPRPESARVELAFRPSPESLKRLSELPYEAALYRLRDGRWLLLTGGPHEAPQPPEDYELALHNHVDIRLGIHSVYSPFPSPQDFGAAAGQEARFFVISKEGIVEWNPRVPMPADFGRLLAPSQASRSEWMSQMEATFPRRAALRLLYPSFYPAVLRSAGVAVELKPWKKVTAQWLENGRPPLSEPLVERHVLPPLLDRELEETSGKLGLPLDAEARRAVLAKTSVYRERWHSGWTHHTQPVPDGQAFRDGRIELTLRRSWRRYEELESHFRVLFSHEYTHLLQFEGRATTRYGMEPPAVAVELLRALELVGMEALRAGKIAFIGVGVLDAFEQGREWVRRGSPGEPGFHWKGFLAGAAYEAAAQSGRPEDAWAYLRRAILEPR